MKIIINRNQEVAEVFSWRFRDLPDVETVLGDFESLPSFDCVATAGNCYGLMDTGMDLALPDRGVSGAAAAPGAARVAIGKQAQF